MAAKRDVESITEADGDMPPLAPSTKRARILHGPSQRKSNDQRQSEAPTDMTYGQRYCFSILNETMSDADLEFEDETEALAYLQSVRQAYSSLHEANEIPHLLVAPKSGPQPPPSVADNDPPSADDGDDAPPVDRSIHSTGHGDARGYYQDGAYTAAPSARGPLPPPPPPPRAIDAAYFDALATAFRRLRTALHQPPPAAGRAPEPAPPRGGGGPPGARSRRLGFAAWAARLRQTDPRPAQVAAMDKAAVLRLLRVVLGGRFLRRGAEVQERTSRWLWALLARLPDRGEMDHAEVGHVRELGKRAVLLMKTLKEMAALREAVDLGGHDGVGDEGAWVGEGDDWDEDGEVKLWQTADKDGEVELEQAADEDGEAKLEQASTPAQAANHQHTPLPLFPTSDAAHPPSTAPSSAPDTPTKPPPATATAPDDDMEEGEIADESEPMDMEEEDSESAKARMLANLEDADEVDTALRASDDGTESGHVEDPMLRARMNMRATLNMILTVAGEFYGQRDLLEFRDPFHGI